MTITDPNYSARCLKTEAERLGRPSHDHSGDPLEREFQEFLFNADLPYTNQHDRNMIRLGWMGAKGK